MHWHCIAKITLKVSRFPYCWMSCVVLNEKCFYDYAIYFHVFVTVVLLLFLFHYMTYIFYYKCCAIRLQECNILNVHEFRCIFINSIWGYCLKMTPKHLVPLLLPPGDDDTQSFRQSWMLKHWKHWHIHVSVLSVFLLTSMTLETTSNKTKTWHLCEYSFTLKAVSHRCVATTLKDYLLVIALHFAWRQSVYNTGRCHFSLSNDDKEGLRWTSHLFFSVQLPLLTLRLFSHPFLIELIGVDVFPRSGGKGPEDRGHSKNNKTCTAPQR